MQKVKKSLVKKSKKSKEESKNKFKYDFFGSSKNKLADKWQIGKYSNNTAFVEPKISKWPSSESYSEYKSKNAKLSTNEPESEESYVIPTFNFEPVEFQNSTSLELENKIPISLPDNTMTAITYNARKFPRITNRGNFDFRLTEEDAVEDATESLNEAIKNSKFTIFDRLFNTKKYQIGKLNKAKISELQENLNVAKLRLATKPTDSNVNYTDIRLSNMDDDEALMAGIDQSIPFDLYTGFNDLMDQKKTLNKIDKNLLDEFMLTVKAYDKAKENKQHEEASHYLDKMNNLADDLSDKGASDDDIEALANYIFNNPIEPSTIWDAHAINVPLGAMIVAPVKSDRRWTWVFNHERNHLFQNAKIAYDTFVKKFGPDTGFDFSRLPRKTKKYLEKLTEQLARGTQIKDFFGLKDGEPITASMLRYAKKYYNSQTGLNNNMSEFFNSITDFDKAAKWLSYAMSFTLPTVTTATLIQNNYGKETY